MKYPFGRVKIVATVAKSIKVDLCNWDCFLRYESNNDVVIEEEEKTKY